MKSSSPFLSYYKFLFSILSFTSFTVYFLLLVVRTMFEDLKRNGSLLRPTDSATILVALLRKRNFKSGDHVDYYDSVSKEANKAN